MSRQSAAVSWCHESPVATGVWTTCSTSRDTASAAPRSRVHWWRAKRFVTWMDVVDFIWLYAVVRRSFVFILFSCMELHFIFAAEFSMLVTLAGCRICCDRFPASSQRTGHRTCMPPCPARAHMPRLTPAHLVTRLASPFWWTVSPSPRSCCRRWGRPCARTSGPSPPPTTSSSPRPSQRRAAARSCAACSGRSSPRSLRPS